MREQRWKTHSGNIQKERRKGRFRVFRETLLRRFRMEKILRFLFNSGLLGRRSDEQFILNIIDSLHQRICKFVKILFIQKDLVLLVFLFADSFALCYCDVKVFFRFRRFYVEKISALSGAHALRKNLILVG